MPGYRSATTDAADGVAGAADVTPLIELMEFVPALDEAGAADFVNDAQPLSSSVAETIAAAAVVPDLTEAPLPRLCG
jgi:hypothetical protein